MIIDSIKNVENYKGLEKIYDVLKFIENTDFSSMATGKYLIDEDNLFYMVQVYDTKPDEGIGEIHKKYIDIQLIVKGEEIIGYAPVSCEKELVEEKLENDCIFYKCETTKHLLKDGDFMVLYPDDIHSPGLMNKAPSKCNKVVFKVKI